MKEVTVQQLKDWQESNKPHLLVDVREGFEREAFNIGGSHIPMSEVMRRVDELSVDDDLPVVVYCEKGIRSCIVIQRLEQLGFRNLHNLSGGMSAWKKTIR